MPAAVLRGPGVLEVEDVPVPALGPNDVLVEVDRCGVCGSDLHLVLDGWGQVGSIPGHEWTGVVAEIGPGVTRWRAGDAVVGGPTIRCGTCRHCIAGRPSLCSGRDTPGVHAWNGAFARYTSAPEGELLALPAGVDSRTAALTEPLAVALHGITRSGAKPGDRVLVSGAGPIGALTIAALRALGFDDVVCVEPGEQRRLLAEEVGAAQVKAPDELDQPTIAEPGRVVADPFDIALECSGNNRGMEAALGQLERGGTLVLVGAGMSMPKFDSNRIVLNEVIITGAFTYDADGFDRSLGLLASGKLPLGALIEPDDVPLSGTLAAMHGLAEGRLAGKVMVKPS
jgi:threonine dehydrogenase-like Zn-dependent dehydrogenase